ncbi:putative E3 ubiquitin-protein ligase HUWE1 [Apostichopus japonicus]|uniref:Putative E3 ubiquitin-protein ligase HUWE1 n=1 Tax=Stichopus japonicus TaxID=307972 RepID=A0A2G8LRI2_STIJA|nr:putative E3 ubiquitin-protein ligase HUWE1 [Apostichopus japonicus]
MKIDRSKLKKTSSDVSADCQDLIERLKTCPDLLSELKQIKTWNYGKSELYQWVDVLDKFDSILEQAAHTPPDHSWHLTCDRLENKHLQELVHSVLTFTALLVEHSFSRHLYNSVEHLTSLLASSNLNTVLAVLNLVYVFSKRSNFLIKLSPSKRQELFQALTYLAESWGGKDNGFGLAACCHVGEKETIPESATTLHFEFYHENQPPVEAKLTKQNSAQALTIVHMEDVDTLHKDCATIMERLVIKYSIPKEKQMLLFTHVRLAHCFSSSQQRLLCVQARLQALSVLVYSSAIFDIPSTLLYTGLVEELVEVLQVDNPLLVEIKAASLRTLTSVIHLDRNPELVNIIEATGASSYHGFLPVLVRQCIQAMIDPNQEAVPHVLATALFSFLYHLASYGTGGEALVYCNMMESLLKVIKWHGEDENHTTFVTRAVRVVDLITNLDMAAFQTNGGLSIFLNRLEHEVNICRTEVPYVIRPTIRTSTMEASLSNPASPSQQFDTGGSSSRSETPTPEQGDLTGQPRSQSREGSSEMETDSPSAGPSTTRAADDSYFLETQEEGKPGRQCFPQRAALLKSMLNFLKKAIPDPAFADSIRHVMDGSLPRSLKHLISNAEYYGPSLFLLACEFVTVYVFQEPSLLSSLQDTGLTDVMLHALLIKDVPATKEVLGSLPNIFSALCLNARGLEAFVKCKPFDKLFKVLLSPAYLPAMRRRRSNEIMGDTALSLGSAMDELMRHQPSLKSDAMKAIIKLLEEICSLGRDKRYTCAKTIPKGKSSATTTPQTAGDDTSSDDDDDEEAVTEEIRNPSEVAARKREAELPQFSDSEEKKPIPLLDYIFNVMKFVEAILCTNATDDHCWEFVGQKGHEPLMEILRLPNLPIDFPSSQACQSVASVCKAILSLAREPQVLKQGLQMLKEVLEKLEPLNHPLQPPEGSILLKELLDSPNPPEAPLSAGATPLLHSVVSAHSYVTMLYHVCKVGQGDVRTISINQWGTDLGQEVLAGLCQLYTSLVWESIVLLSLFTPGSIPENCDLGKQDMKKLLELTAEMQDGRKSREHGTGAAPVPTFGPGESPTTVVSSALSSMEMEDNQPTEDIAAAAVVKESKPTMNLHTLQQLKQEVPALYAPSRLGKALSELFGLLVKLCVGSSMRHRIRPNPQANQTVPPESARKTARSLMELLMKSLQWKPPTLDSLPKFRLTFYICAVSFASPMLFDDKKQPYHLMLQKFFSSGAHKVLFEAFDWALSPDNPFDKEGSTDLTEGTCEFIDAWLVLIKKMVNPEGILESPHAMPVKSAQAGFVPFQAVQFLINTHKAAFQSLMKLWNSGYLKNLGSRTSESVLAILCHILRGESVIAERLKQIRAEDAASGSVEGAAGTSNALSNRSRLGGASSFLPSEILGGWGGSRQQRQEPSEEHIQQLIDMGFPRVHAIDALNHTASLPQAAEWAISHQPRLTQDFGTGMSEEEEVMQAIAMSLGGRKEEEEEEEKKKKEEEQKRLEALEKIPEEEPLTKESLDDFVNRMLPGCLTLMDDVPDIVARVCDLLVIANERNGVRWRDDMLQVLIDQIAENARLLKQLVLVDSVGAQQENKYQLNSVPQSPRLAARIHLLCLLFDEMKMPCAKMIESSGVLDVFVSLVNVSQQYLSSSTEATTPKWLAPLLLLLDLYEKAVVSFRRKLSWVNTASHYWKWFDDSSGRWSPYSRGNNKTIDDAFWAGKSSVRFTAVRRKYIVNFNRMVQVNEETMNRRPIMQALKTEETGKKDEETTKGNKKQKTESGALEAGTSGQDTAGADDKDQVAKQPEIVAIKGLQDEQITSLLRSCIGLIGVPVEPDALHAVLRLCLRFTRNHQHALMFLNRGSSSSSVSDSTLIV